MNPTTPSSQTASVSAAGETPTASQPDCVAWEELENGRFRPRRVRGSCLGMELG